MVTINDVAKICKVSRMTVSRALNTEKVSIRAETKEHVLEVVKKLNYQPNTIASALKTKLIRTIGLISYDISDPFFSELIESIEEEANKIGYDLILCITRNKAEKELKYIKLLQQQKVDGMIIIVPQNEYYLNTLEYLRQLKKDKFPFIVLGNVKEIECDYVTADDVKSAQILTEHLICSGYKKFIFVYKKDNTSNNKNEPYFGPSTRDRIKGIKKSLKNKPLSIISFNELTSDKFLHNNHLLNGSTAVIAQNDFLAFKIWHKLNKKILKKIILAGFGDISLLKEMGVSLVTVKHPYSEMAKKSIEFLLNRIKNPKKHQQKSIFEQQLVTTESIDE